MLRESVWWGVLDRYVLGIPLLENEKGICSATFISFYFEKFQNLSWLRYLHDRFSVFYYVCFNRLMISILSISYFSTLLFVLNNVDIYIYIYICVRFFKTLDYPIYKTMWMCSTLFYVLQYVCDNWEFCASIFGWNFGSSTNA